MAFSVAPTLGRLSVSSLPRISGASQWSRPPPSRITAPSCRREDRWRSMGRGPSSHPPGIDSSERPQRLSTAPRKITDERISRIRWSGTSQRVSEAASTTSASPSHSARQPRCRRIRMDASTSRRRGQLCSVEVPLCKMVAAKMGSTLFFAPWTCKLPLRALPPSMIKSPIKTLRSSFSQKLHHLMRRAALFVPFPRRAYFSRRRSSITVS